MTWCVPTSSRTADVLMGCADAAAGSQASASRAAIQCLDENRTSATGAVVGLDVALDRVVVNTGHHDAVLGGDLDPEPWAVEPHVRPDGHAVGRARPCERRARVLLPVRLDARVGLLGRHVADV